MGQDLNATGIDRAFPWRDALTPLVLSLLIFWLHAVPGTDLGPVNWTAFFHVDKWVHALMFGVLSTSSFIALGKSGNIRRYKVYMMVAIILYGIGLEFAQGLWFVDRYASWGDILADVVGVFIGRVVFRLIYGVWN